MRIHLVLSLVSFFVVLSVSLLATNPGAYFAANSVSFQSLNLLANIWPYGWENITELGSGYVLLPIAGVVALMVKRGAMVALIWTILPTALLSRLTKDFFDITRPAGILEEDRIIVIGEALTSATSTPSGHTMSIFACLTAIVFTACSSPVRARSWTIILLAFLIAIIVGVSRSVVGAHWPMDVALGSSLGYFSGMIGLAIARAFAGKTSITNLPITRWLGALFFLLLGAGAIMQLGHLIVAWVALGSSLILLVQLGSPEIKQWLPPRS